jgi:hypothetical protein
MSPVVVICARRGRRADDYQQSDQRFLESVHALRYDARAMVVTSRVEGVVDRPWRTTYALSSPGGRTVEVSTVAVIAAALAEAPDAVQWRAERGAR